MKKNYSTQLVFLDDVREAISIKLKEELLAFKNELQKQQENEELLTRKEASELLKIDPSTLWHWTKKGKIQAYGIANRRYYKRSELMECLTLLNVA